MHIKAIIIWHYYENGKIVDYSTTEFTGLPEMLKDCLDNNPSGNKRNIDKKVGERTCILHQVLIL